MRFGKVGQMFVLGKLDRWGRLFGLVKFKEVSNEEEVEKRLEEVWMGDAGLKVNKARFGKEDNTSQEESRRKAVAGRSVAGVLKALSYKGVLTKEHDQDPVVELRKVEVLPSEDRFKET